MDLQGFLAEIRDAGGKYAVLEASSHSLMMDRLWGCHFKAAVFTNLTHEHMDFHKTFEEYFAAKELVNRKDKERDDFIREHLHEARWREVILLAVGIIGVIENKEERVTELVQDAILNANSLFEE